MPAWQAAVRDAVRDPAELPRCSSSRARALGARGGSDFPLLVPRGFVARMRKGDPRRPAAAPSAGRTTRRDAAVAGFGPDPVREQGLAAAGRACRSTRAARC